MFRFYCDGREFGRDYRTLEEARAARAAYVSHFPSHRYYIRRAGR